MTKTQIDHILECQFLPHVIWHIVSIHTCHNARRNMPMTIAMVAIANEPAPRCYALMSNMSNGCELVEP